MNRHYTGVFLIVVSAVGFGLMPIFALQAYRGGINLTTLLLIRFSCAALILFAYLLITGGRIAATWRQILSFYIMGGVLYTLQSTCYFLALKHLSASLTALVLYTYPILVALLSLIFERERLTGRVVCSILLCFAGLVLALGASIGRVDTAGIILAFCAPLVYSCYILAGNRLVKQVPSLVTSAFVALFAATSFLVVGSPADPCRSILTPVYGSPWRRSWSFRRPLPSWPSSRVWSWSVPPRPPS